MTHATWWPVVGVFLPGAVVLAMLLSMALLAAVEQNRKATDRFLYSALAVGTGLLVASFVTAGNLPPDPEPAPVVVQIDGVLAQCIKDGGVQMAHLDGRWVCIAPDQAG